MVECESYLKKQQKNTIQNASRSDLSCWSPLDDVCHRVAAAGRMEGSSLNKKVNMWIRQKWNVWVSAWLVHPILRQAFVPCSVLQAGLCFIDIYSLCFQNSMKNRMMVVLKWVFVRAAWGGLASELALCNSTLAVLPDSLETLPQGTYLLCFSSSPVKLSTLTVRVEGRGRSCLLLFLKINPTTIWEAV